MIDQRHIPEGQVPCITALGPRVTPRSTDGWSRPMFNYWEYPIFNEPGPVTFNGSGA